MAANPEFFDQPFDDASGDYGPPPGGAGSGWDTAHGAADRSGRDHKVGAVVVVVLLWNALSPAQQARLLELTSELGEDGPARTMHLRPPGPHIPPVDFPGGPQPDTTAEGLPFVPKQSRPTFDDGASGPPPAA